LERNKRRTKTQNQVVYIKYTSWYFILDAYFNEIYQMISYFTGADPGGGGAHPARAPPKIGKNMIFWRKIVIFHTKYPNNFRASLHSAQFF
jgi:hypothetical protein